MTTTKPFRVGILGAARIARKNVTAIGHADSRCVVAAVASRTTAKAEALVNDYVKRVAEDVTIFGGENAYNDLVNSQDVCDAIYIPLPTMLHKEWVIKALRAGKHVVVEKPVSLNVEDYEEMLQVAYETGKFLMDGTMYPHHNRTIDVVACSRDEDRVGKVDRIESSFSFLGDESFFLNDIRTKKDGDPLGCLGDLGWYCIRMALLIFPTQPIAAQAFDFKLTDDGVPLKASCLVYFEGDRVLVFHCAFLTPFRQSLEICGSKKSIKMDDYVLPKKEPLTFELHSMSLTDADLITLHEKENVTCDVGPVQEVLLWQRFSKLAEGVSPSDGTEKCWGGNIEANVLASMSLSNQKILIALMDSIRKGGAKINI